MSNNMHVKSAVFGAFNMGKGISYRSSFVGQADEDSSGIDKMVSGVAVVGQRGIAQVAFRDWDDALSMEKAAVGSEATLVSTAAASGSPLPVWPLPRLFRVFVTFPSAPRATAPHTRQPKPAWHIPFASGP